MKDMSVCESVYLYLHEHYSPGAEVTLSAIHEAMPHEKRTAISSALSSLRARGVLAPERIENQQYVYSIVEFPDLTFHSRPKPSPRTYKSKKLFTRILHAERASGNSQPPLSDLIRALRGIADTLEKGDYTNDL